MLPVDISGNLTRPSLIYNHSSKGSNIINPLVIERMNTNYNYKSYIQSVNTVNDSDKNYFSHIINPNFPTDGLKLWLDPYDLSTITFGKSASNVPLLPLLIELLELDFFFLGTAIKIKNKIKKLV